MDRDRRAVGVIPSLGAGEAPLDPASYGVYYDRREPSFYTGFAPRTPDPRRLHLHIGRGNQLRVTAVLADDVLTAYARDLWQRWRTYRALSTPDDWCSRRTAPSTSSTNGCGGRARAPRTRRADAGAGDAPRAEPAPARTPEPRTRVPHPHAGRRGGATLERKRGPGGPPPARRRPPAGAGEPAPPDPLWVLSSSRGQKATWTRSSHGCRRRRARSRRPTFERRTWRSSRVSARAYPVHDGEIAFDEYTAIYPVGTFSDTRPETASVSRTTPRGRRTLTTHQRSAHRRSRPTDEWSQLLAVAAYIHVGTNMHNSFHTLCWQMERAHTVFLPAGGGAGPRRPRQQALPVSLAVSRGPMSHGCTDVNVGTSPSCAAPAGQTERLYDVDVYYNRSEPTTCST